MCCNENPETADLRGWTRIWIKNTLEWQLVWFFGPWTKDLWTSVRAPEDNRTQMHR